MKIKNIFNPSKWNRSIIAAYFQYKPSLKQQLISQYNKPVQYQGVNQNYENDQINVNVIKNNFVTRFDNVIKKNDKKDVKFTVYKGKLPSYDWLNKPLQSLVFDDKKSLFSLGKLTPSSYMILAGDVPFQFNILFNCKSKPRPKRTRKGL